jgi:quinolinate synthase
MAMNDLVALDRLLCDESYRRVNEIHVDAQLCERARRPLDRMLAFQQTH